MINPDFAGRCAAYCQSRGIAFKTDHSLGSGLDGCVWPSSRNTAIKVLERQHNYRLELECYQRFREADIDELLGFAVPTLIDYDDALLVIEMQIVSPPFILDFAKVHLDQRPEFPAETLAEWRESMQELFEDHWPQVRSLLIALEQYGIYYLDAKPGNIMFERRG